MGSLLITFTVEGSRKLLDDVKTLQPKFMAYVRDVVEVHREETRAIQTWENEGGR